MTRIGVVVNEGKELGGGLEELRAALADLGHADPPWYEVPKSKEAPEAVRRLVEDDGVERVVVWGGDGTVRRAIHTILDAGYDDASVGIMPAGTSNGLAVNLGIPIALREAAEIAVTGDPRPIDVGEINGQHFAVRAGVGFEATVVRDADESGLKDRFGRWGYVWAGIRNVGFSPACVGIDLDGKPWYRGDASGVMIANVATLLGHIESFPHASPTDGRLDVGVMRAESRLEWLRLVASGLLGRADRSKLADVAAAETVTVELDRSLPWEVDGGDREREAHFHVRCLPAAIRIARPRWSVLDGEDAAGR